MSDISQALRAVQQGNLKATEELLPPVSEELPKRASQYSQTW